MGRIKSFVFVVLSFASVSYAVDAFYRHHQRTVTTSLESDLVNREIGIDGSARNSLIAKKADGNLIHIISKEMDTASLNGVLNVAGQTNLSGAVKMANYTSGRVPYFSTGGLITDASTFTYNGTTLAVNNGTYSGTLGVTGLITGAAGFQLSSAASGAAGKMYASTTNGTVIWGLAGSTNDLVLTGTTGSTALRIPTGTINLVAPGTLDVAGLLTATGGILPGLGSDGAGRIFQSSVNGLKLRGVAGSSNDFAIMAADNTAIFTNPTGTTGITLPTAVTMTSTAGTGTRVTTSTSTGVQGNATTIAGANTWSDAQTFTTAPILSAATASRLYATNGSKAGTSNAALTINGFTYPDGAGSLASTSAATNGQLLIGSTSAAPVAAALTGTANEITVTNGAGSITLDIPNSPVFTTPNIGAATATSVAASGAVSGVSLATTGGEAFTYGDTSFTITVSVGMTTTPTGTAIGTKIGKVVTLFIPHISGTSNSTSFTLSGIPPTWTPATVQHVPYMGGTDNGVPQFTGIAYIMTDNTILLGTAAGGFAGWTNSGTKATGFSSQGTTLTYLVL